MYKTKFLAPMLVAALCAALCAPSAFAKTKPLKNHGYTRQEQISATKAINFSLVTTAMLNKALARAYGAQAVFISPAKSPGKKGFTLKRTQRKGRQLIVQLAAYEPLTSVCAVDSGVYYLMHRLSQETSKLLTKRGLSTPLQAAHWSRKGDSLGMRRLGAINELNCVPVRAAFNKSVLRLEDAFMLTRTALNEAPKPKKKCGCRA